MREYKSIINLKKYKWYKGAAFCSKDASDFVVIKDMYMHKALKEVVIFEDDTAYPLEWLKKYYMKAIGVKNAV